MFLIFVATGNYENFPTTNKSRFTVCMYVCTYVCVIHDCTYAYTCSTGGVTLCRFDLPDSGVFRLPSLVSLKFTLSSLIFVWILGIQSYCWLHQALNTRHQIIFPALFETYYAVLYLNHRMFYHDSEVSIPHLVSMHHFYRSKKD